MKNHYGRMLSNNMEVPPTAARPVRLIQTTWGAVKVMSILNRSGVTEGHRVSRWLRGIPS